MACDCNILELTFRNISDEMWCVSFLSHTACVFFFVMLVLLVLSLFLALTLDI